MDNSRRRFLYALLILFAIAAAASSCATSKVSQESYTMVTYHPGSPDSIPAEDIYYPDETASTTVTDTTKQDVIQYSDWDLAQMEQMKPVKRGILIYLASMLFH